MTNGVTYQQNLSNISFDNVGTIFINDQTSIDLLASLPKFVSIESLSRPKVASLLSVYSTGLLAPKSALALVVACIAALANFC